MANNYISALYIDENKFVVKDKDARESMVQNVSYDSSNKKITKTINGSVSDIVAASTLKSDMQLDNVGNFKAVSTYANQGLSETEKSNARSNIGATDAYPAGTTSLLNGGTDTSNRVWPAKQISDYVKGFATNATHFKGSFNARNGNINNESSTLTSVQNFIGDMYVCDTAGTMFNVAFEVGDSIIFRKDVSAGTAPTSSDIVSVESTVSVVNNSPTLNWNTKSTIGSVDGVSLEITLPNNPNTDERVTSVNTHYSPEENEGSKLIAQGGSVAGVGEEVQVVTGIKRDQKGHVTGIISAGVKNTDTHTPPTSNEVKLALGVGTGTTRYLREDGNWGIPEGGQQLVFDNTPTSGSSNPVTSSGIKRAIDSQKQEIDSEIDVFKNSVNSKIEDQDSKISALNGNAPVIGPLPSSGETGKIYRVPGTTSYTDYAWNGSLFITLATYNNAIDQEPIIGSENLVTSGGVAKTLTSKIYLKQATEQWWIPFDFEVGKRYLVHLVTRNCDATTYLEAYKNRTSGPYYTIASESQRDYDKYYEFVPDEKWVSLRFETGTLTSDATFLCEIYTTVDFDKLNSTKVFEKESTEQWWEPFEFKQGKVYHIRFNTTNSDASTYLEAYKNPSSGPYETIFQEAEENYEKDIYFIPEEDYASLRFETGTLTSDASFSCEIYVEGASSQDIDDLTETVNSMSSFLNDEYAHIEDFFKSEMQTTIDSVNELVKEPCLSFAVLTDSHERIGDDRFLIRSNRSINNIKHFNQKCFLDGVVHLGDLIDTVDVTDYSRKEQYDLMQNYLLKLSATNKHFYAVNGNHDGESGWYSSEKEWYRMVGRLIRRDSTVNAHETAPYFFVDHAPSKTRCIFLSNPEQPNDTGLLWGFSDREITWLTTKAMSNIPAGYNIIFFSHVPPFAESGTNNAAFKAICNAFNNHTTWSNGSWSVNFSNETGKIAAFICGHWHEDLVCYPGWSHTITSGSYAGTYTNDFPFVIVLLDLTYWNMPSYDGVGDLGGIRHGRVPDTYQEDLWTIMVYRPNANKINFVRFGAGTDFEVNV